jgi:hypothetical protein
MKGHMTQALPTPEQDPPISEDLLETAAEFANFIYGNKEPETIRKVRHLITIEEVPAFRFGGKVCGFKSAVTRAIRARGVKP